MYIYVDINILRYLYLSENETYEATNIVELNIKNNFLEKWNDALFDEELRISLIQDGINDSDQFITEFKNSVNVSTDGLAS